MNEKLNYIRRLTYTCIYSKSTQDAAQNMFNLISNKECGFEEGKEHWKNEVEILLSKKLNLQELNFHSTSYSNEWWSNAFEMLLNNLKSHEK